MQTHEFVEFYQHQVEWYKGQIEWANKQIAWLNEEIKRHRKFDRTIAHNFVSIDTKELMTVRARYYRWRIAYNSRIAKYEALLNNTK